MPQPMPQAATPTPALKPAWTKPLSTEYFVNSVAICDDGSRVVAGTFYHDYSQGPSAAGAPDARAEQPPRNPHRQG
jgi:hypothetical protein